MGYDKDIEIVTNPYNIDCSKNRKGIIIKFWSDDIYDFIIQNEIKAIYLNTAKGWKGSDYSFLSKLKTIKPLSELKKLKSIAFFGSSKIKDGDLSSLEKLPKLAMLGFVGKRHYSHKLIKEWNWNNIDIPSKLLEKK